nr:unnamed protein product [Spirometra erinaceieuropaei]
MQEGMISASSISYHDAFGKLHLDAQADNINNISFPPRGTIPKNNLPDEKEDSRPKREFWIVRSSDGNFEELYVRDCDVVCCRLSGDVGHFPLFTLTMESPIITACWATFMLPKKYEDEFEFDPSTDTERTLQRGVCVFESQRCTFVEESGTPFLARLPFHVEAVWPLKSGVLLERRLTATEKVCPTSQASVKPESSFQFWSPCRSPCVNPVSKESSLDLPSTFTVFLMTHPLDEMTPVLLKVPGSSDCQPKLGFANDVSQRIVGTIDALSLVITFNSINQKYSIWQIEKAVKEDYAHLYSLGEDGRITVAPRALTDDPGIGIPACNTGAILTPSTVPLKSGQPPFCTPVGNAVAGETFSATPSGCRPLFASPAPYLSPFRASLQRLKAAAEPFGRAERSFEPTQTSFTKFMHETAANSSNFVSPILWS